MTGFDITRRLKRAVEQADAISLGKTIEMITPRETKEPIEIKQRFTVFRSRAGIERPLAFGMTESEAKGFVAVARWKRLGSPELDFVEGELEATYRIGEENEL